MSNKLIVTDIETFSRYFAVVNYDIKKDIYVNFEISDTVNQLEEIKDYYKTFTKKDYMVTFNGIDFDWPILYWILQQKKVSASNIYKYTQQLINCNPQFKWKFRPPKNAKGQIGQIDLYKIFNYENPNRRTSLKYLQFTTRWETMQDIPYHHSMVLTREQELEVLKYCINDVASTTHFLTLAKSQVDLRFKLSKKYKKNYISHSEPKLSSDILLTKYCNKTQKDPYEINKLKTARNEVVIKDIIFDYIKFKTKEFSSVLNKFKSLIITEDNSKFKIETTHQGLTYDYGLGGIHSSRVGIFEEKNDYIIIDADVVSYYPQLAIQNEFYPEHLGKEFCEAYSELFDERKLYNKKTHFAENYVIKIALNSAYGLSNASHSFIYDPLYTYKTTITGQLSISMLIEEICETIPEAICIGANTDGATFKIKSISKAKFNEICSTWEKLTKLQLEYANYSKMFIRDVNSYISIYDYGGIKLKGCFEINTDFHKNSSQRIVPIAVANYVVNGVPYAETIRNHLTNGDYTIGNETIKNYGIYDFCIGKKASVSNYVLSEEGKDYKTLKDKVLRYYIAKTRKKLLKKYTEGKRKDAYEAVNKGWFVEMFMNYEKKENYNIEYLYYIEECRKLIDPVEKSNNIIYEQQTLF